MKKTLFTIAAVAFLMTSCQQTAPKEEQTEMHEHDHNGMGDPMEEDNTEVHEAHVCPMKCEGEKTYSQAGECPVCHMELEKQ